MGSSCVNQTITGALILLNIKSLNSQRISFLSLLKNCNHKGLGIYYLLSAFIFGTFLLPARSYQRSLTISSSNNMNLHRKVGRMMKLYFVLLMKSHLQSYPCPLQINSFWNLGFLLGITHVLSYDASA